MKNTRALVTRSSGGRDLFDDPWRGLRRRPFMSAELNDWTLLSNSGILKPNKIIIVSIIALFDVHNSSSSGAIRRPLRPSPFFSVAPYTSKPPLSTTIARAVPPSAPSILPADIGRVNGPKSARFTGWGGGWGSGVVVTSLDTRGTTLRTHNLTLLMPSGEGHGGGGAKNRCGYNVFGEARAGEGGKICT